MESSQTENTVPEPQRALVFCFSKFLEEQIVSGSHPEEFVESLEVAKQCIEQAFEVNVSDPILESSYGGINLPELIAKNKQTEKKETVSQENKDKAMTKKTEANELMKESKFDDAIKLYTEAIELDPSNGVYYCNRAAAYQKKDLHRSAIDDCKKAIRLDSKYAKAYGRMGLAYSALRQHADSRECFAKAAQLDPTTESYKTALAEEERMLQDQAQSAGGMPGFPGMGGMPGGLDFGSILSNPAMMASVQQMMTNPQMQDMMSQMMATMAGQSTVGGESNNNSGNNPTPAAGAPPMGNFLAMGAQLAEQFTQSNPELVEQLRRQQQPPRDGEGDSGNPPPGTS